MAMISVMLREGSKAAGAILDRTLRSTSSARRDYGKSWLACVLGYQGQVQGARAVKAIPSPAGPARQAGRSSWGRRLLKVHALLAEAGSGSLRRAGYSKGHWLRVVGPDGGHRGLRRVAVQADGESVICPALMRLHRRVALGRFRLRSSPAPCPLPQLARRFGG